MQSFSKKFPTGSDEVSKRVGAEGIWLRQESKESNLVHASMRDASGCLFVIIHADGSS